MNQIIRALFGIALLAFLSFIASCGGGGGGSGGSRQNNEEEPIDVSGHWDGTWQGEKSGDSESGGGGGSNLEEPAVDLSGIWSIDETVDGNCPGSTYPHYDSYQATIIQTGNNLTVSYDTDDGPANLTGTISGNTITFSGNQPSSSGTTYLYFSGTVS